MGLFVFSLKIWYNIPMSKLKKKVSAPSTKSAKERFIEASKNMKLTIDEVTQVFSNLVNGNDLEVFGETVIKTGIIKIAPKLKK